MIVTRSTSISLGYNEITSPSTLTGTTIGPGTNPLTVPSVACPGSPIRAILSTPVVLQSVDQAAALVLIGYSVAGAGSYTLIAAGQINAPKASGGSVVTRIRRFTIAAGTYDFQIQLQAGVAGQTVTLYADLGTGSGGNVYGPSSLAIERVV